MIFFQKADIATPLYFRITKSAISVIIILFFSIRMVYTQSPIFRNFNVKDGVASSEVYAAIQDAKGYMWFATENGASRYDGVSFKTFTVADGLADNTIIFVQEDSQKRIWFTPLSGLPSYYYKGKIYPLPVEEKYKKYKTNPFVEDKDGTLWFGTIEGVFKFYRDNRTVYEKISIVGKGRSVDFIIYGQNVISGTDGQFGFYYNTAKKEYRQIINKNNLLPPAPHLYTYKLSQSFLRNIYTVNDNDTIQVLDTVCFKQLQSIVNYFGDDNKIIFLKKDNQRNIWTGTFKDGLFCFPADYPSHSLPLHFLKEKTVSSIYIDTENNQWITTIGEGIYFLPDNGMIAYTSENSKLSNNKILSMTMDADGAILLGLNVPEINILKNDSIRKINLSNAYLTNRRITALKTGRDGTMWIGMDAYLGKITDRKNDKVNLLVNDAMKCIEETPEGGILVGTSNTFYYVNNNQAEDYGVKYNIFPARTNALHCDKDSAIWVGTEKGLYKIYKNKIEYFGNKDLLLSKRITCIKSASKETLVVGTNAYGIVLLKDKEILTIQESDGLASDNCKSIFIENENIFWVATNKGISKVLMDNQKKTTWVIKNYTQNDGLISNETAEVLKIQDTVWVATSNGLNRFIDKPSSGKPIPTPTYITRIRINSIDTSIQESYNLKTSSNNLVIDFIGLSYKSIGRMLYRYKMEGLDTSWSYTGFTSTQYPSLPTGKNYNFIVSARTTDGIWNAPAKISFFIAPLFWQTWWFKIGSLLFLVCSTGGIINYRQRKIENKERAKTELNKKIAEMEMKALRSQMNPHFIFNSMNAIQQYITQNDPFTAQRYLAKFAKLIRNILDNSKRSYITIKEEMESISIYLELERMRFENKFDYTISIDPAIDTEDVTIPSMFIQPFIENAIWHGLMHKEGKGNLLVKLECKGPILVCTIQDDGIGRKKAEKDKENNSKTHKSHGMQITKERLEIFNQQHHNNNLSFNVTDLEDNAGHSSGTRVEIFIITN